MKTWLHRLGKIARSHFPIREVLFPTDIPAWETPIEDASPASCPASSSQEAIYYANLELPMGASFEEIKRQYRILLRRYHPDGHAMASPEKQAVAKEIATRLNEAYDYFRAKQV